MVTAATVALVSGTSLVIPVEHGREWMKVREHWTWGAGYSS